jgi:hypothetical protein
MLYVKRDKKYTIKLVNTGPKEFFKKPVAVNFLAPKTEIKALTRVIKKPRNAITRRT